MSKTKFPRIQVEVRDRVGSRYAGRLRQSGRLPAVIYGHKQDPVHVSVDLKEFSDVLHERAQLVEVAIDSTTEPCLIKQVQWDHLGAEIVHVDLTRVDLTERVTVGVKLELAGEAVGLKDAGAILEHPLSEIQIECQASDIPSSIRVDIGGLEIGGSISVGDIAMPEGAKAAMDAETIIASIRMLAEEPEEEVVEAAEGEPEVIGKKEDEAEGQAKEE